MLHYAKITHKGSIMKTLIKNLLRKPYRKFRQIFSQVDFVPSGHFYSPIQSDFDIQDSKVDYTQVLGVDLKLKEQLKLLKIFGDYYQQMPFKEHKEANLRYYFDNPAYCHSDGICLYAMIRHLRPKKIIEVGSGFSSALMHDVNDIFFKLKGGGSRGHRHNAY